MNAPLQRRRPTDRVSRGRKLLALALVCCCLAAVAVPGVVAAQVDDGANGETEGPTTGQSAGDGAGESAENGTVVRHADPASIDDPQNLGMVERYLLERLANRLDESAVRLEAGEYDAARGLVGSRYDEYLRGYVSVAGQTGGGESTTTAAAFERAGRDQRRFVDAVEAYETTYAEYETARERGEPTETRRLARNLEVQATRAEVARERLEQDLPVLESTTDYSFEGTRQSVAALSDNVTTRQSAVRSAEFQATSLRVLEAETAGSYIDPIRIVVRLTDSNGTPVTNHTARFGVGERRIEATTDDTGVTTVAYRPTTASVDNVTRRITYLPPDTSPYFRSGDTVSVTVTPVTPSVTVDATDRVSFGVPLVVTGRVTVENGTTVTPVSGLPVVVRVGDRPLLVTVRSNATNATDPTNETEVTLPVAPANVTLIEPANQVEPGPVGSTAVGGDPRAVVTDDEGRFRLEVPFPVDVPVGTHRINATAGGDGLAVGAATATTEIRVTSATTSLSLAGVSYDQPAGTVFVRGRLASLRGVPVANTPVGVRFAGTVIGEVETDDTGRFGGTLAVPASVVNEVRADGFDTVPVEAVFAGAGTNLAPGRSPPAFVSIGAGRVSFPAGARVSDVEDLLSPAAALAIIGLGPEAAPAVAAGAAGLLIGAVLLVRQRRRRRVVIDVAGTSGDRERETDTAADRRLSEADDTAPVDDSAVVRALLERAERVRAAGDYDTATRFAYLATRRHLASHTGVPDRGTHREFGAEVTRRLRDDVAASFTDLTDRFERTAFSGQETDATSATRAVMAARTVVSETGGPNVSQPITPATAGTNRDESA